MERHDAPSSRPRLRVGLVAPPWVPVPPPEYGGTELVVDLLARGLEARGCHVVLFATGDSTCPVGRRWVHPRAVGTSGGGDAGVTQVRAAYASLHDVDVIHDHTTEGPGLASLHPPGVPVVTTMHGRPTPGTRRLYGDAADRGVAVIAISHDQRHRASPVPVVATIHHGIDVGSVPVGAGDGGYVLFLGRMSPDKGVHTAIDVARAAGWPLVMAAKMRDPAERAYFRSHVEPRLGPDARYVGEVGGREKLALLGGARALVNPIAWPEPFGLVMIEALACGTPVLAFPEGAAPEIVRPGRTGYLCRDAADMAARLRDVDGLDRDRCRADAEARFSADRMVDEHLELYRRLVGAQRRRRLSVGA